MLSRPQSVQSGQEGRMPAGVRLLSGLRRIADATAASMTWPVSYVLAGWISRSGPGAGYGDTTPSADGILAALPDLTRGDSFSLLVTDTAGQANTLVAGSGITLAGTTAVAASNTREYLLTLLSDNRRTRVCVGSTTNATGVLSNISQTDLQNIGIGMLVTGTNVGASAAVTAVSLTAGTVTVSVVSTGTADNTALTFTPNFELRGVRTGAN